jgi:RNA polymerase sigma-70 factor, ECF subfamily
VDRDDHDEKRGAGVREERRAHGNFRILEELPDESDAVECTVIGVYTQYGPFAYRTLQQLGVRYQDLDDLLHDVFIVVHRRLESFDPNRSVKAWLYGICKNKVLNHRKSARWRREVLESDLPDPSTEELQPNPEQCMSLEEQRKMLAEVLEVLDLDKRAILVMYEIDGMSYAEIAEVLDIPNGTVGSRLSEARNAFKKALTRRKAQLSKGGPK